MENPEKKKYNIVYADPPWDYNVWNRKDKARTAASHYKTTSMEHLKKMNIVQFTYDNCVLFMWATLPCYKEAVQLAEAWGFAYKTVAFVWIKINKNIHSFFTGLGHYTRANAEMVLLFAKGEPLQRINKNVGQVVVAKVGKHSVKPAEIREWIVSLFGDLPRIELFAFKGRFLPEL